MWYDKRSMRALFYGGAMSFLIGLGITMMTLEYRMVGIVIMCVAVGMIVIGFNGLKVNLLVEDRIRKKKGKSSSQQK